MEPPSSFLAAGKANAAHFQDELQQSDIPAEVLQLAFSKLEARDQTRAALVSWHFRVNVITQARSEQNALVTNFILSLTKNLNKERYAAVITALTQIWRTCPVFSSLSLMSIKENLLSVRRDVINQLKHLKDSEIKKLNEAVQEQPLPLHFQRLFDLADIYRQLDEGDLLYETRCLLAKELVDAGDLEKASEILKATPAKGMVECGQREEVYKYVLEQFGTAEKFHKAQFFFAAILDELLVRDWLNSLARKLAESGHFDEALKVAGSDRAARIMVIEQLAKARHFERAFEVAKMLGDNMPSDVCYTLATELAKADEFDLAIQLARAFPDKNESIYNPVKTVVRELGRVGQTGRALELLEPIQADYQRNQFIQEMVHGMADAGKFEEAIIANRHFRGEYSCYFGSMTLGEIGKKCLQVGKIDLARDVACMIEDPLHKSSLFIDIGRKLMEIGQIIQAVETIQLLKDPAVESEFLLEVVSHVKKRGDFQEARWVANNIPDLEIKRKILTILP